jgi:hypothetical protein
LGNSNPASIRVTGEATVNSITPSSGSINGGQRVTIIGNGFDSTTVVKMDTSVCKPVSVAIGQLICITAPHAAQDLILLNITYSSILIFQKINLTWNNSKGMVIQPSRTALLTTRTAHF